MTDGHFPNWHVGWKSGAGNRWSVQLFTVAGEEVIIRASTPDRAETIARAVRSADKNNKALQHAYSALFVHGDCERCNRALEDVMAALGEHELPLTTSVSGQMHLSRAEITHAHKG
jgi:hypothetical protein